MESLRALEENAMLMVRNKIVRTLHGILETGNLLFLSLLVRDRGRARLLPGIVYRHYMTLRRDGRWRCRDVMEVFPNLRSARVVTEHLPGEGINTPLDELVTLALVTHAVRPRKIFEIGTFRGRTALNFALNSPAECVIHTMDLPPEGRDALAAGASEADQGIIARSLTGIDYQGRDGSEKIRQLYGDSTQFDFGPYLGQMDLVFVDGAHHYEAACSDTQNALKMVRPGGVILWHDFANYGDYNDVTRAVLDILPGDEVIQLGATQLALYRAPE